MKIKLDGRRRVTIPTIFSEELGIKENSVVNIELKNNQIMISNANEFNIQEYIEEILGEDISFETERYLKEILKKIKGIHYE